MLNQFSNISCYEEFEIQVALTGISKIDVLKRIGHQIDNYYFFISEDGIFNWYDLNGNYIKDPSILKELKEKYIIRTNLGTMTKCIIPNSVTSVGDYVFYYCESLKEITIPNSVRSIGEWAFCKCKSLTSIIIPDNVINIGDEAFLWCESLKEVIFKGRTLDEVKRMKNYPFGIENKSIIKCEM